ncbi:MAG: MBL fold hydrolase [Chloroflexi bacterium RBG_13_46_14]|nr:MAG: MBL fold hydrolase [Chloroflexi bacterium RBG_13_46_14]
MLAKLQFLGAAQNVTGSRFLLEANGRRILVDCGLYQERKLKNRNWEPFPFDPASIDVMLLTHAHVDHSGLIPKLVKDGFRGNIYCTRATADIVKIILLDAAHLQEEDAAYKKKRHEREKRKGPYPEIPLYTTVDAEASFSQFTGVNYREEVDLGGGISAKFHDAGHVLGSSTIKVSITQNGEHRSILFSGDVGRDDKPILKDKYEYKEIDYAVVESTYGNRVHEEPMDISEKLADIINSTVQAGGHIIVPSFALQRAQEVLYYMNKLLLEDKIPDIPVYLDSPMAIRITEVFKHYGELYDREMAQLVSEKRSPLDFPGLQMVQTAEESKALNFLKHPAMIIAGSGMCTGGRIKHHLVNNITRPESTILFVGYQAVGTLGRNIVDGIKKVRILGQRYPVRARIAEITGFSAHADRNELVEWMSGINPRRVFVVHGETKSAREFGKFLRQERGWKVSVPMYGESAALD